jgi:hypothetical protein
MNTKGTNLFFKISHKKNLSTLRIFQTRVAPYGKILQ